MGYSGRSVSGQKHAELSWEFELRNALMLCSARMPSTRESTFPYFYETGKLWSGLLLDQRSSALLILEANCLPDTGAFAPNSTGGRLPQENN
jgi:hypothetical protein